ncbi:MAG: hypothetical protein PHC61_10405 [Chitinivibrionales bacterium]|nr:hypothetical protein [Chitinivibrionales bacterium]
MTPPKNYYFSQSPGYRVLALIIAVVLLALGGHYAWLGFMVNHGFNHAARAGISALCIGLFFILLAIKGPIFKKKK